MVKISFIFMFFQTENLDNIKVFDIVSNDFRYAKALNSFGIDFGTTNSAIAVLNNGEPEVIRVDQPPIEWEQFGYDKVFPSVFGYGENAEALFGWEAKLAITENKIEAVKSNHPKEIGRKVFQPRLIN